MILVINDSATENEVEKIKEELNSLGCRIYELIGLDYHILGILEIIDPIILKKIEENKAVEKIIPLEAAQIKATRLYKSEDTMLNINNHQIGGNKLGIIAGPCSVESEKQILSIARDVKKAGANFLRGGAFKPRTSPYTFQGLGEEGLEFLKLAKEETGLPIVTEIMSVKLIDKFVEDVDVIQVGARNMQNYELLRELGKTNKPILLKRGISATIEEFLLSAEYILAGGNENVILCERGIRTFEKFTRNTLDLSSVVALKKLSHLPVIVDPSHSTGLWWMIEPLSKAAISVGADGLLIEVHNEPDKALSDGKQSLTPENFSKLMEKLKPLAFLEGKEI
ncbi:MAG: 3-deoxy-7-phosphoheptulonate synthase [Tissierellales bacterium]|nr:3-deoxy-7-phosphoheptulonate synthase [Tissierellales bacterium]